MAKRKKAAKKALFPDELIVCWEEDENSEDGGYVVVFNRIEDVPDGQEVGIYSLANLGTVTRTTELKLR